MCNPNESKTKQSRFFTCENITIIIGSFYLNFITVGMMQSFGILYVEIVDHFKSTNADISWISSLCTGLMLSLGPFVGILEKRFGCRALAVSGSVFVAAGMASSMFVNAVYQLYFTYGILAGVGFALLHLVANTVVSVNISKGKSIALGLSSSGIGVGSITFPYMINSLLTYVGWKWTFLALAGICILAIIPGALFKGVNHINDNTGTTRDIQRLSKKILSRHGFILFTISGIFVAFVYLVPYIMTPKLAMERGINKNDTPVIITVSGATGLVGRIGVGLLCESKYINPVLLNGLLLVFGGFATALCVHFTSLSFFIVYGVILGIAMGTFGLMQPLVFVELVGEDLFSIAFGYGTFLQGIALILGPPVAGWIADYTEDYFLSYYFTGLFVILGGIFSCLVFVQKRCIKRKHTYNISRHTCTMNSMSYI